MRGRNAAPSRSSRPDRGCAGSPCSCSPTPISSMSRSPRSPTACPPARQATEHRAKGRSAPPNRHADRRGFGGCDHDRRSHRSFRPCREADVYGRHLPASAAFGWLRAGWRDLTVQPGSSLLYGLAVFLVVSRHRRRAVPARPRLHPVPGARRLHGGRPAPGRRALRKEPLHRGGRAGDAWPHDLRRGRSPAGRSCSSARSSAC